MGALYIIKRKKRLDFSFKEIAAEMKDKYNLVEIKYIKNIYPKN